MLPVMSEKQWCAIIRITAATAACSFSSLWKIKNFKKYDDSVAYKVGPGRA